MHRVLIVEDDFAIQHAYAFAFEKAGFIIDAASNGEEAIKLLDANPKVILLDMLMPGLSGLDFLREAQPKLRLPNVKIIALSNIDSENIQQQARELGVDRYLIKVSLTPADVVKVVQEIIAQPTPAPGDA